jgi:hypothetical protein
VLSAAAPQGRSGAVTLAVSAAALAAAALPAVANARPIAARTATAAVEAIQKREVGCGAGCDITPSDKLQEPRPRPGTRVYQQFDWLAAERSRT